MAAQTSVLNVGTSVLDTTVELAALVPTVFMILATSVVALPSHPHTDLFYSNKILIKSSGWNTTGFLLII
jgi:hypothetical protein